MGGTFFLFGTILLFPASYFLSPKEVDPLIHWICRAIVLAAGVNLRVHGIEKLHTHQTYIFVFNHINQFDHFFLGAATSHAIRGIEHEKHFCYPIYGPLIRRIGQISVPPRGDTARAIEGMEKAKEKLEKGISIAIAPEGTRSPDGKLQDFKKGAFHLAVSTQTPIVPCVLVGAYAFNRKGDWHVYPGRIDIYFEDLVSTQGLTENDVTPLRDQIRKTILNRLIREGEEN